MIGILKNIFGMGPKANYKELLANGAQIIDVRSKAEYQSGHIRGSVNIPLQSLESGLSKIRKDKAVITCCASGMRSASAKSLLLSKGYTEVYNGGGWMNLQQELNGN